MKQLIREHQETDFNRNKTNLCFYHESGDGSSASDQYDWQLFSREVGCAMHSVHIDRENVLSGNVNLRFIY